MIKSTYAYIECQLGKETVKCLLDTGSEISLCPASTARHHRLLLMPTTQGVQAANGQNMHVKGICDLNLKLTGRKVATTALVTANVD